MSGTSAISIAICDFSLFVFKGHKVKHNEKDVSTCEFLGLNSKPRKVFE
jgi:hypothetical protein